MNKTDQSKQPTPEHEPSKFGRKIILWVISILIILFIFIVVLGHNYIKSSLKPLDPKDTATREVNIPMGATDKKIGSILQESGIVKSGFVFDYYTKAHNITAFRSGYYEFAPSMSLDKIADMLKRGGAAESLRAIRGKVEVKPGARIVDVAAMVANRTNYSQREFLTLMNDKQFINQMVKRYPDMLSADNKSKGVRYFFEGYLYPATYSANGTSTLKQLVERMLDKTDQELKPYYKTIKARDLTVQQVMTIASLVQAENVNAKNGAIIAGVLYNKIDAGLPLNSPASVAYAVNDYVNQLTKRDYQSSSPYNLHQNIGFGPGPIGNPPLDAIKFALNPTQRKTGYLYYVNDIKNKRVFYSKNQINSLTNLGNDTVKNSD